MKDGKEISEDDYKRIEKLLEKAMDDFQSKLETSAKAKEQEIMTV